MAGPQSRVRARPGGGPSPAGYRALREVAVYQRFLDRIEPDERRYHDGDPVAELRKAVLLSDGDSASPSHRLDTWAP